MIYSQKNINTLKAITSLMPPIIANLPTGKYAVFTGTDGGWFKLDSTVTLDMVRSRWQPWSPKNADTELSGNKSMKIQGSKGNMYNVSIRNGRWTCDCIGFGFRGRCKHVEAAKLQMAA